MACRGRAWCAVALWTLVGPVFAAPNSNVDIGVHRLSPDARYVVQWVLQSANHQDRPFAIVDKKDAHIYLFEPNGRLTGSSPALLGQAWGDSSAPDVGEHTQAGNVPLAERTTPSGRFVTEPGFNLNGEHVVWVDYAAALAIHRVRPGSARPDREARLGTATPQDNRVSLGCVVVPAAFYMEQVLPLLGRGRAVVYVLPEESSVRDAFNAL